MPYDLLLINLSLGLSSSSLFLFTLSMSLCLSSFFCRRLSLSEVKYWRLRHSSTMPSIFTILRKRLIMRSGSPKWSSARTVTQGVSCLFLRLFILFYFLVAEATDDQLPKPGIFVMSMPWSPGSTPDSAPFPEFSLIGLVPSKSSGLSKRCFTS